MKNLFFLLFLLSSLMMACNKPGSSSSINSISGVVPSSTGAADEIMFVLPSHLYTTATKKAINNEFNKVYRILPAEESVFNISKVEYSVMNSLMFRFRNIVLMANTDTETEVLALAKEILSPTDFEKLTKGEQQTFILKNVWSKPQNVVLIFGKNQEDLQANLEASAPKVMNHISATDLEEYKKIAYLNGVNQSLKEQWLEYHGIALDIPSDYKLAENEGNFVSLRKDVNQGMIFIFFDVIEYSGEIPDFNNGIALRDERGTFVSSDNEGSFMKADTTLGFKTTKTLSDNLIKYETSGLWRMENDFMGGPFINQYIIDDKNNRVIFLDGFIYAPGDNKKKRYMRQLEGIFSTLEVNV